MSDPVYYQASEGLRQYAEQAMQTRIAALEAEVRDLRAVLEVIKTSIIKNTDDTVWISPVETVVDYIDAALNR